MGYSFRMQKWIFGLLITANAFGAVGISYSPTNDLILTSKSCSELQAQSEAICAWSKKPQVRNTCRKTQSGYALTVSSCLPDFVKQFQNKKNVRSGANCWGTALSFKKHAIKPRFIWSQEMTYWLNSPLCRKLSVGEKKMPGDLINMFGPEYAFGKDETTNTGYKFWEALYPGRNLKSAVENGYTGYHHFLHTETYVSDILTFGKDSPSKDDKFSFKQMNEVYGRPRETECQENQALDPHFREYQNPPKEIRGSKCAYFSVAYRCENFEEYFKTTELDEVLKTQEKLFPLLTILGTKFSKSQVESMVKLADEKAREALNELEHSSLEKKDEMLLVWKYFSAEGIRKSLELADLIPATEER